MFSGVPSIWYFRVHIGVPLFSVTTRFPSTVWFQPGMGDFANHELAAFGSIRC